MCALIATTAATIAGNLDLTNYSGAWWKHIGDGFSVRLIPFTSASSMKCARKISISLFLSLWKMCVK